jgi:hypothetical protein
MRAPHDPGARRRERRAEPGRLRIVNERDVAGPDEREDVVGVAPHDALVAAVLGCPELAAVAGRAVEPVMDAFGDGEELGIPLDDEPAGVDPGPAHVGEQGLQHLRDPAAGRCRVDVVHRSSGERLLSGVGDLLEASHALRADERFEPGGVERLHLDLSGPEESPAFTTSGVRARGPRVLLRDDNWSVVHVQVVRLDG